MWSVKEDGEVREALIKEKAVEIFQPDWTLCVVYQVGWKAKQCGRKHSLPESRGWEV